MTRSDDRYFLPVEGLVSGALTCVLPAFLGRGGPALADALFLFIGCIFGAAIAAHLWLFRGLRSAFSIFGFVATCTVAYAISLLATVWTPFRPDFLNFSGPEQGPANSSPFFTGGLLGAAIVCAGVYFFFAPGKDWRRFLAKALGISVICGFLGVFGWAAGERLWAARHFSGFGSSLDFYVLYMIWQTGTAGLLGFLLPRQAPAPTGMRMARDEYEHRTKRPKPSAAAVCFLVLVVATLCFFMGRQIYGHRIARRVLAAQRAANQAAEAHRVAETPSMKNLPAITELPAEQILVLRTIAGHPYRLIDNRGTPGNALGVPTVGYWVNYEISNAPDGDSEFADVSVTLYPNTDWASYWLKGLNGELVEGASPPNVETVTKFGNKVVLRSGTFGEANWYVTWVSGNRLVQVRFFGSEEDEFLREYLELNPSSL